MPVHFLKWSFDAIARPMALAGPLPSNTAKLSMMAVCFSLLLFIASSVFTTYAQQGGNATGGDATGPSAIGGDATGGDAIDSGAAPCYGTCNYYYYGGQASGGAAATGDEGNTASPSSLPSPFNKPSNTTSSSSVGELINKGNAFYRLGKFAQAITYYDRALDVDPSNKLALFDKGNALNGLDRHSEAIQYFDIHWSWTQISYLR